MWIAASAVVRDPQTIATEQPALWREVRRFNLPVKLALGAAHRVATALAAPGDALLVALAPCRPGSPELDKITRDLDVGFDDPAKAGTLRVNPIYTLHAIDNLALSALSLALRNTARAASFGGAMGQGWAALEYLLEQQAPSEALVFAGDQSDASWHGTSDPANALGVAIAFRAARGRGTDAVPHAAHGRASGRAALAAAPAGRHVYDVLADHAHDRVTVICEVVA